MTLRQINSHYMLPGICRTHPSICKHGGERFMSYRVEIEPINRHSKTAMCRCDADWNPIPGTSDIMAVDSPKNSNGDEGIFEDVRLTSISGRLYFYGTNRDHIGHGIIDQTGICSVIWETEYPPPQKNWTAWDDGRKLAFARWPFLDNGGIPAGREWEYGDAHGGTPLIEHGSWHVGFFHSHIEGPDLPPPKHNPSDVAMGGGKRRIYFGSPYARCGDKILFPDRPLLWPRLYGASLRAPNNHSVIFPCGLVRESDTWTVSFGDDKSCWLAEFSTEEIFSVLQPT